jgi:transposase
MIYIGFDVHKKRSTYKSIDPLTGEIREGTILTTRQDLHRLLSSLDDELIIAGLEACREAQAVCKWLRELNVDIHLADPTALKASLPRRLAKTDKIDANLIVTKLKDGTLPEAYLASPEVEQRRILSRNRQVLRHISTLLRNLLRILFCQAGFECHCKDLKGKAAQALVEELLGQLPPNARLVAGVFWQLLDQVEAGLSQLDQEISAQVKADAAMSELSQRPGYGPITTYGVAAEIGEVTRFAHYKKLHAYCGAVPRVAESGERRRSGTLPEFCNKHLRHLAVLAAQSAARSKQPSRAKQAYERVKFRYSGKPRYNTAKIAAAREILTDAYFVLRAHANTADHAAA